MKKKGIVDEELKNLSPWLHDMKQQEDGFGVPPGYFDQLEASVFQRIESEGIRRQTTPAPAPVSMTARIMRPRVLMSAAAAISLLISAWWFFRPQAIPAGPDPVAMQLSDEEVESWILENVHEFDEEQLAAIPDETTNHTEESNPQTTKPAKSKSKTQLEDLTPEDLDGILKDMSDEELEDLL